MPLIAETCVATHRGDRPEQQDRVALFRHPTRSGLLLAVLADGMGGHAGGAMAADQVVIRARQNFEAYMPNSESPRELLGGVLDEAHRVMRLTRFTSEQDPHSTAVLFLLQRDHACWAHCGDSRLYHIRGGRVLHRTQDHSLVGALERSGRIDGEAAVRHPRRNVLLSCLGGDIDPEIIHGEAGPLPGGDAFVLCTDGLWSCIPEHELAALVQSLPPRAAAARLIELARTRASGLGDNISVVIVKLVERAPAAPHFLPSPR